MKNATLIFALSIFLIGAYASDGERKFREDLASILASMDRNSGEYTVRLTKRHIPKRPYRKWTLSFLKKDAPEDVLVDFPAHEWTVFFVQDDVLYIVLFHPQMPGHTLIAHDLVADSELWRNFSSDGLPVRMVSLFENRVNIYLDNQYVELVVHDSQMDYVNRFDRKTGSLISAPRLVKPEPAFDKNDPATELELEVMDYEDSQQAP